MFTALPSMCLSWLHLYAQSGPVWTGRPSWHFSIIIFRIPSLFANRCCRYLAIQSQSVCVWVISNDTLHKSHYPRGGTIVGDASGVRLIYCRRGHTHNSIKSVVSQMVPLVNKFMIYQQYLNVFFFTIVEISNMIMICICQPVYTGTLFPHYKHWILHNNKI